MNFAFLIKLSIIVLTIPVAYASDFGTEAFSGLFPLLAQLSDQNHPVDTQLQANIVRATDTFTTLVTEFNNQKNPLPPEYTLSIDSYREHLQQALNASSSAEASTLIQEISQDAEVKKHYMINTSGFLGFKRSVLVTVNVLTFRGENSEPGYTVTCNPFRDSLRKTDAKFPFASETNHASLSIPPGRYRLQLYKGQKEILGRDIVIGLSSSQSEEVRIDVSNF